VESRTHNEGREAGREMQEGKKEREGTQRTGSVGKNN